MKDHLAKAAANRREFLRGGLRAALLGGVAAVTGVLATRNDQRLPGQVCITDGGCRGCAVVGDCGLPQAMSFRHVTRGTQP